MKKALELSSSYFRALLQMSRIEYWKLFSRYTAAETFDLVGFLSNPIIILYTMQTNIVAEFLMFTLFYVTYFK